MFSIRLIEPIDGLEPLSYRLQGDCTAIVLYQLMKKKEKLFDQFNQFIRKLDTTARCLMGSADFEYRKVTVTEYKTENKAMESTTGKIKEGQCIILKSNFTYGCSKGFVYRIHARKSHADGSTIFTAIKLNWKLTKGRLHSVRSRK